MKVTALIPDELVEEVKTRSQGKNLTEALIIALKDWVTSKRVQELNSELKSAPVQFKKGFNAKNVRDVNRRR